MKKVFIFPFGKGVRGKIMFFIVLIKHEAFVPERSKGVHSSCIVFVLVGSNPTGCITFLVRGRFFGRKNGRISTTRADGTQVWR